MTTAIVKYDPYYARFVQQEIMLHVFRASKVRCKDGPQYLLAQVLLARYWTRDWEQLSWYLDVLRNNLPIGKLKHEECDSCHKPKAQLHQVHELRMCNQCIVDFVNSKIVRTEVRQQV